ncbi:MAG: RluA family pseudouridine synthase [Pseudomonadota bacterium]|nr:RluA family pseudouridine synthase [Pseudomonadota bacterium]
MTTKPHKKHLVTHQIVDRSISLNAYLRENVNLTESTAQFLMSMGAVYINEIRTDGNPDLNPNDYLRIHHEPKRFPADKIEWKNTVIFENSELLVIDKPYGIPVHATLDNNQENVLHCLSEVLKSPLLVTHRLDIGTSGLLVLAKNVRAQRNINEQFAFKKVRKFYSAVVFKSATKGVTNELALGFYTHYMKRDPRAPKVLSREAQFNWKKCDLELVSCQPVSDSLFRVEIELLTGRSHQIRAQFSLLGSPILGDIMYGGDFHPAPDYAGEFYFLSSTRLKIFDFDFIIPFSLRPCVPDTALKSLPETLI